MENKKLVKLLQHDQIVIDEILNGLLKIEFSDNEDFYYLYTQTKNLRFISAGGILKEHLNLIKIDEDKYNEMLFDAMSDLTKTSKNEVGKKMKQSDEHREAVQVSVDVVLLTLVEQQLHAVLLRRQAAPFAGVWALPGGFIHTEEDADAKASAARVLRTKVGIEGAYLEQLATFSGPARDPRGWSVAIAYCALLPVQNLPPNRSDISVVPLSVRTSCTSGRIRWVCSRGQISK